MNKPLFHASGWNAEKGSQCMPTIQLLDPHVADLIAAGEVVERPASVVKELVENAIDAGAGRVTVEIQHGGMTLIRVTDNGCGIPPGEAATAFLRHATSKLHTAGDLAAIGTLGFRGEALAAIAAVSRVELLTRAPSEELGVSLALEGGVVQHQEEAGCPAGSTFVVRDLFFNTPARLKFMKRDAAEGAAVFAVVQKLALSHPELSLKFIREGRQELLTPGDGKLQSALYSVLGRDLALGFVPVDSAGEDMKVTGFVSQPVCCRGTRATQHFFVNGRQIRSRLLTAALEEAYQNQKMVGKFPGCVLHLETRLNGVDVNVHPAKTEVKFLSDKKIFDGVYYAVLSALERDRTPPAFAATPPSARPAPPVEAPRGKPAGGFQTMTAAEYRQKGAALQEPGLLEGILPPPISRPPADSADGLAASAPAPYDPRKAVQPAAAAWPSPGDRLTQRKSPASAPDPGPDPAVSTPESSETAPMEAVFPVETESPTWRMAGEVLDTYIVAEQGDTVYLIDKHAAHERMHFDRMKAGDYKPMGQMLLTPIVLNLPPQETAALLEQLPLLEEFGFGVGEFGGGAIVVRQTPFDLAPGQVESALEEIAESLLVSGRADPSAARDCVLHTMACKAAIKGGQKNAPEELYQVAQAVLTGQVKYCPHGRPVAMTLTRAQLEKQFKRT